MKNSKSPINLETPGQKENIFKASLHRLSHNLVMMHKTQIRVWQAMLITVFIAGFASALILAVSQDWFVKIFGAPGVITNQASVTYQDASGNNYSGQSNQVLTTVTETVVPVMRIKIEPEEKTADFSANFTCYIYPAGTNVSPSLQETNTSAANGEITLTLTNLTNGSYDLKIVVAYHLSVTIRNVTFSGSDVDLRTSTVRPKAGNLNNDDIIDSRDWAIMSPNWASANQVADINSDGMVNTLDWGLMNRNWLATGT